MDSLGTTPGGSAVAAPTKILESTVNLARWYALFSIVAGTLMLGVGGWIGVWQIIDLREAALSHAEEELERRAETLAIELQHPSGHVERMRLVVEALLRSATTTPPIPWDRLRDGPDGPYVMLAADEAKTGPQGGFFVLGTVDGLQNDPPARRRIEMSLVLLSLLGIEFRVHPGLETTWYRRFGDTMVIFPRVSPADFRAAYRDATVEEQLSLDTLGMPFWRGLRTDVNPEGLPFWTMPYMDILGKGTTVTCAAPVRENGEVVGMVGTDVVLSQLVNLLESPGAPGGRYLMVGAEHGLVLAPGFPPTDGVTPSLDEVLPPKHRGDRHERRVPVRGTPWELVWTMDRRDLLVGLLPEAIVLFLLLALLSVLVLTGHLAVRRRLVRPAIALVQHLEAEARGEHSTPPQIPPDWQRWFESVTDTFKLRQIAENLPVVVGRLRWDGEAPPALVFVGEGFHAVFAVPPDVSMEDFPFLSAIHPEDRETALSGFREAAETGAPVQRELRLRSTSDAPRWIRGFAQVRADDPTTFDCMAMDITRERAAEETRRRFELRMQQAQKAESLGILAGGVAHDFNNILMGMIGSAELAEMDLPEGSPLHQHLREIIQGGRRASELAHQMLAYAGRGRLTLEHVSLNALVRDVDSLLEASISKKATLHRDLATELSIVEGDPTQLRQVIMNLVINASEAIGDRPGTITISTGARDWSLQDLAEADLTDTLPPGRYAQLEVIDTGSGMDEETRHRVFDPFFSTKFLGRGLGLASVLGIIRGHSGAIGVTSEPERGTAFRILLPVQDAAGVRTHLTPLPMNITPREFRGIALVVDDEPIVRKVVGMMLRRLGFEVLTANDGVEALDLLTSTMEAPSLVLLDYSMPHMDGPQTLAAIRAAWPGLPVVLCSGFDAAELADSGITEATAYLQKPIRFSELADAMDSILNDRTSSTGGDPP